MRILCSVLDVVDELVLESKLWIYVIRNFLNVIIKKYNLCMLEML